MKRSKSHGSIRHRFSISLLINLARAGTAFLTGIIVARGLGPSSYGDLIFLLGSFTAIRALLDMGSSSAFFTFLSQRPRGRSFIYAYLSWQGLQLIIMLLLIGFILPWQWFETIWLGHQKALVIGALGATFFQQQVWQTFGQIGDSLRHTVSVQLIGLAVVIVHFTVVLLFWKLGLLEVGPLLALISAEYVIASLVAWKLYWPIIAKESAVDNPEQLINEYWTFCSPILLATVFGFAYTFFDNWLLHRFAGSRQQGLYGMANQLSIISMFATISLLQIFWKEVAEAHAAGNYLLVENLYRKTSRFLYSIPAIVAGWAIPWSSQIIDFLLGPEYVEGSLILVLMMIYPMHQTMGQVNSTMFSATCRTATQTKIGIASALLSMPVSYLVLAPIDATIPGLGLGALGMALKLVIITSITVNLISWWFCRTHNWTYDWTYQVQSIGGAILAGGLSYFIGKALGEQLNLPLIVEGGLGLVLYAAMIGGLVWRFPDVIGLRKQDILSALEPIRLLIGR